MNSERKLGIIRRKSFARALSKLERQCSDAGACFEELLDSPLSETILAAYVVDDEGFLAGFRFCLQVESMKKRTGAPIFIYAATLASTTTYSTTYYT